MKAAWIVKCDPGSGAWATVPDVPRLSGPPSFGPERLSCQATSWVDKVFCRFLPVVEMVPETAVYVEVDNDPSDWSPMHGWILPRSM